MPTIFHKILATTVLCLAAVGLSSCVLETHQRVLDTAKEYEGIIELHDAVYQVGSRLYVQGVRTTLRRSNRNLIGGPYPDALGGRTERSGVYKILSDAPRKTVYREFRLTQGSKPFDAICYALYPYGNHHLPPKDDAPVWPKDSDYERWGWHPYHNNKGEVIAWYLYAIEDGQNREYVGDWQDALPIGARPILLSAQQIAEHPVLSGKEGVGMRLVSERSEACVDKARALYAYPLAGVCWLVPDALVTGVINLPLPLVVLCLIIGDAFD